MLHRLALQVLLPAKRLSAAVKALVVLGIKEKGGDILGGGQGWSDIGILGG